MLGKIIVVDGIGNCRSSPPLKIDPPQESIIFAVPDKADRLLMPMDATAPVTAVMVCIGLSTISY